MICLPACISAKVTGATVHFFLLHSPLLEASAEPRPEKEASGAELSLGACARGRGNVTSHMSFAFISSGYKLTRSNALTVAVSPRSEIILESRILVRKAKPARTVVSCQLAISLTTLRAHTSAFSHFVATDQ